MSWREVLGWAGLEPDKSFEESIKRIKNNFKILWNRLQKEKILFNHDRSEEPYGVRLYDVRTQYRYVIDSKENGYELIMLSAMSPRIEVEGNIEEIVNYIRQNITTR